MLAFNKQIQNNFLYFLISVIADNTYTNNNTLLK